jgi:predicted AAA+ superfamily ATPase
MPINSNDINRLIDAPQKSFLLLGPRGVGKSRWLKSTIMSKADINLLKSDEFLAYQADPSKLRRTTKNLRPSDWVIIDEVQRVPELLNEVHLLYEENKLNFALSGSSARKLRRSKANLLAGRALQLQMFPLTFGEIGSVEKLSFAIEFGTLPLVFTQNEIARDTLTTYVETYLKEEIAAEALTRTLAPFSRFLNIAAQYHAQLLNIEKISAEASLKRTSVDNYFRILEDTLLGFRLPALSLGYRSKEASHPKFYFFDAGVARAAAGWVNEDLPGTWLGFSFESLVLNEIRAYNSYKRRHRDLFHYTVTGSFDIDIVVETNKKIMNRPPTYTGIEVKYSKKWNTSYTKNLKDMISDSKSKINQGVAVYLGEESFVDDAVQVYTFSDFCKKLWEGEIF